MDKISLVLPWPPSTNRLWRNVRGQAIRSKPYRDWEKIAALALKPQLPQVWTIPAPYCFAMTTHQPTARRQDLDNRIKSSIDLVFHMIEMDDCWIDEIRVLRGPIDRKNPRVEIVIEALSTWRN